MAARRSVIGRVGRGLGWLLLAVVVSVVALQLPPHDSPGRHALQPAHALPPAALISPSALYQQLTRLPNVVVLPHPQPAVSAPTPAVAFGEGFGEGSGEGSGKGSGQRCAPLLRLR
jgi:hypothetical protein